MQPVGNNFKPAEMDQKSANAATTTSTTANKVNTAASSIASTQGASTAVAPATAITSPPQLQNMTAAAGTHTGITPDLNAVKKSTPNEAQLLKAIEAQKGNFIINKSDDESYLKSVAVNYLKAHPETKFCVIKSSSDLARKDMTAVKTPCEFFHEAIDLIYSKYRVFFRVCNDEVAMCHFNLDRALKTIEIVSYLQSIKAEEKIFLNPEAAHDFCLTAKSEWFILNATHDGQSYLMVHLCADILHKKNKAFNLMRYPVNEGIEQTLNEILTRLRQKDYNRPSQAVEMQACIIA